MHRANLINNTLDISAIVFWIFAVIIVVALLSILPAGTFFLYKLLSERGRVAKKVGLAIFIGTTFGRIVIAGKIIFGLIFGPGGFGPEYESVVIEQKIGGKLVCKSVFTADHHSWQYNVGYEFITLTGDTLDFGRGSYHGREWKKNEQLQKSGDWLVLRTGYQRGSDQLILRNIKTNSRKIHILDNNFRYIVDQETGDFKMTENN